MPLSPVVWPLMSPHSMPLSPVVWPLMSPHSMPLSPVVWPLISLLLLLVVTILPVLGTRLVSPTLRSTVVFDLLQSCLWTPCHNIFDYCCLRQCMQYFQPICFYMSCLASPLCHFWHKRWPSSLPLCNHPSMHCNSLVS